MTPLQSRKQSSDAHGLFDEIELVRGTSEDYQALAEHHYRDQRPATFMRVLAIRQRPSAASHSFPSRSSKPRTVAVLVESMPPLNCRMRDVALSNRYRCVKDRRIRAAMINRELRTISRVIVHPQWRGLGLAGQMVRAALSTATTVFTESIAAMGRVHPFFSRAGMSAFPRPAHEHDARLRAAFQSLGLEDDSLASPSIILDHMATLSNAKASLLQRELVRWFRTTRRTGRRTGQTPSLDEILHVAQRSLLCEPVYFLHDNRHSARPYSTETPDDHTDYSSFAVTSSSAEQQRDASPIAEQTEAAPSKNRPISTDYCAADSE